MFVLLLIGQTVREFRGCYFDYLTDREVIKQLALSLILGPSRTRMAVVRADREFLKRGPRERCYLGRNGELLFS